MAIYGLNRSASTPANPVPAQISDSVAKLPDRRNAMTRKATKKISAVPKSFIKTRHRQTKPE